jgi:hypothetical protein
MNEGESVVADLWNRKLVLVGEKEERRCRGVFRCGELHGVYGYVAIFYSFVLNSDWWYFRSKILQSYFNVLACNCLSSDHLHFAILHFLKFIVYMCDMWQKRIQWLRLRI